MMKWAEIERFQVQRSMGFILLRYIHMSKSISWSILVSFWESYSGTQHSFQFMPSEFPLQFQSLHYYYSPCSSYLIRFHLASITCNFNLHGQLVMQLGFFLSWENLILKWSCAQSKRAQEHFQSVRVQLSPAEPQSLHLPDLVSLISSNVRRREMCLLCDQS